MRFDVYEVARDGAPPHYQPSRTQAVLADAALWQAAGFIAAYIARRSAEDVVRAAPVHRHGRDLGAGYRCLPNDSRLFATDDGRALRVYAVDEASCRFCGRPHRNPPADLCPPARDEYDRVERRGDELGLSESDSTATRRRDACPARHRSDDPTPVARSSPTSSDTLGTAMADPTVVEVLRVEEPAPGEGRRHVVVRWSDGSTGRALSYFADEILVSEGDMVGKTAAELRALQCARDREYLQRDD
jgi:hypothetical protein